MIQQTIPDDFHLPESSHPALQTLSESINAQPRIRLGLYYEALWHYLLRQHPECTLLAHNLPVRTPRDKGNATLGEFDVIYQYRNQIFHRELAVKFYLGIPDKNSSELTSHHHQWVGPGLKDRLDRKLQHTLNHQIQLSNKPEAMDVLKGIHVDSVQKEILIQGRLFYPLHGNCPPPLHSHPDHLRGLWMTLSEFKDWHPKQKLQVFCMPEKRQWIDNKPTAQWLTANELITKLEADHSPQLVYSKKGWFFVVTDKWPARACECTL